ncbi:MAG: histidine kinase, partial [Bacteroidia bacterium]|nr:histidine kinase [Bacteroidia bacterium]
QNYFVSDIYKDHEGNILISTFDHGIIVIPDLNVPDVSFSFKDDPVVSMYSDHQNLYLGTSKGHLINYFNGKLFKVDTNGNRRIEGIYGNSTANFIVYDNGGIKAYNTRNKKITKFSDASLKDAEFVSENKFYLGTNGGIVRTEYQEKKGFTKSLLRNAIFRIYALKYNATDSTLYAATSNGLIYGNNNSFKPVHYHSKAIFPQSLQYHKGKIYAIDNKNKILVIDNKQVIDSIIPIVAGKPEALNKIIIYNNTIIGRSSNGLFMFDLKGRLLSYIHSSFGFATHKIQDFVLHNNKLVVSHTGGVQQIDLNHRLSNLKSQPLNFAQIIVNDEAIDFSTNNVFHHNQNKIEFVMSYPTLKNREGIQYLYQLAGFENKWSSNNYEANKITYNALPAGSYTFTVKVENQSTIVASTSFSFTVSRAFYTSWWFIALCILVFLLLVYIIYRWQLKIHRKKSEMQNELSASKLSAIQSQMNPHFIFNALNSIQDLVLKGDVENSYSYITTFSDLVRRTLSYSQKEFIELDQEIKLLQLYLSLEKLRFKKNFSFEIETVNFEGVLIPPMLIQPFIENSLVHGLLHKEGEKTLKVYFELKEQLICVIEDNGVGREKARTIKQRQNSKHESFSGKAIGHRLEILSKVFDDKFGYAYEDLHDENGATGTRVILSIPVKRTF